MVLMKLAQKTSRQLIHGQDNSDILMSYAVRQNTVQSGTSKASTADLTVDPIMSPQCSALCRLCFHDDALAFCASFMRPCRLLT